MKLLDALDPDTLQQLYADALAGWWDDDAYRPRTARTRSAMRCVRQLGDYRTAGSAHEAVKPSA